MGERAGLPPLYLTSGYVPAKSPKSGDHVTLLSSCDLFAFLVAQKFLVFFQLQILLVHQPRSECVYL